MTPKPVSLNDPTSTNCNVYTPTDSVDMSLTMKLVLTGGVPSATWERQKKDNCTAERRPPVTAKMLGVAYPWDGLLPRTTDL